MARKRLIAPEFFRHGDLYDAEARSGLPLRLAFAGLWCITDRRGLFTWAPREMKLQILPWDTVDFARVLDALEAAGFVRSFAVNGKRYGRIPSFRRWQTFHHAERPSDVPDPDEDIVSEPAQPEANSPSRSAEPRSSLGLTPDQTRSSPTVTVTGSGTATGSVLKSSVGEGSVPGGKRPAPSDEVRHAVNKCLPVVAESAHDALALLLESVPSAATWAGMIWGFATTIHGKAASPERLGAAVQDYVAGGHHLRASAHHFRGFVRNAKEPPKQGEYMDFDADRCEELRTIREQNERRTAQKRPLLREPDWAAELDAKYPDGRTRPQLRAS